MSAQEFAAQFLFLPIGVDPPPSTVLQTFSQTNVFANLDGGWPMDPQGNTIGGWGLMLRPRDMARFGYLYLREGEWAGKQVVPKRWVLDSITPHTAGYGYQWWLQETGDTFVFSAGGQGGQHIYCVPEKDLVVVVTSTMGSRWRERWPLLEQYVIPAVLE
jgi:CubicO group peptidase (beta-lactamase class C family)